MMHLQQAWWGGEEERAPWSLSKKEKKNLAKAWPRRPLLHQSQSGMLNHLLSLANPSALEESFRLYYLSSFTNAFINFKWNVCHCCMRTTLAQCGNYRNSLSHHTFCQNFRESNVFTKELISRNIFSVRIQHTVEKREILSHQNFFSSNQLFSKTVTFTEFLPKMRKREFP